MIIYLDLIFFMNFFYDFLLMLTVSATLKRNRKLKYHLFSSLFGALSIFLLFLKINSAFLLIIKIITSIIMCVISFGYVSFRYTLNNLLYLYMCSIILAGFLYFIDLQTSMDHQGLLFFFKGTNPNVIVLMMISPIVLFIYYKSTKNLKNTYSLYYNIKIYFNKKCITCLSLLDSGNALIDPITKKAIIIVSSKKMAEIEKIRSPVYVPYHTVSGSSLMKCFKPSFIMINHQKIYNYLVGISDYHFTDGVECLLNKKLMEDNYV